MMKCNYYQHLIIKSEISFLNNEVRIELDKHVANCKSCTEFLKNQIAVQYQLKSFKEHNIVLEDKNQLTFSIMEKIEKLEKQRLSTVLMNLIERGLYLLESRLVKYSLLLVSILFLMVFFHQQHELNAEIEGLKNYANQINFSGDINASLKDNRLKILVKQLEISEENVEMKDLKVNKEDLFNLLKENRELKLENDALKKILFNNGNNDPHLPEVELNKDKKL